MANFKYQKSAIKSNSIPEYRVYFTCGMLILCLLAVFAVRLHIEKLTGDSLEIFANTNGIYGDWFLFCKETIYFFLAVVICGYAIGERIFPDYPCQVNPLYKKAAIFPAVCVGGYLLFSCCSGIFSAHKEIIWQGVCTEFEGLKAIFSYCVLFFFAYNFVNHEEILKRFGKILYCFGWICVVLAIWEYAVMPLLELPFMKYLIAPAQYRDTASTLKHSNTFRESMLMFSNSNYAGCFFALLFPIPVYGILSAKNRKNRIISAILSVGGIIAGIMTNATTAFYVMILEMGLLIIFCLMKKILQWRWLLVIVAVFVAFVLLLDLGTGRAFSSTILKSMLNSGTYETDSQIYQLKEISISGKTLHLASENSGYTIVPPYESGEILNVIPDSETICEIPEQSFNTLRIGDTISGTEIAVQISEGVMYLDCGYNSTIDFAVTTDGLKLIAQNGNLLSEIPKAPMADSPLNRYDNLFTGRGYIWLNTLPILKDCLIIGKGAGNFPFYFVQNDVAGLNQTNGTYHLVIDKPHSLYLQIAVTAGIPALICILVLFGSFAIRGMKCIWKSDRTEFPNDSQMQLFVCLYVSVCGYMVRGLVNDSIIAVSPVFWIFMGTAYSLCISMEQKQKLLS